MFEFYKGKKVYITGADGFIGSHLVEELVTAGANVRALVFYNSWGSDGWLNDVSKEIISQVEIVKGDVRDDNLMIEHIKDVNCVFHLASLIAIPYSYIAPKSYVDTNINGTLNVLNACRRNDRLERVMHTSTSEVYGTAQYVPINEEHPLVGQSPYSASKIGADKIAESFYCSFDLPLKTARPFNTYGPRQTARAVIPTIISQALSGAKELKIGALSPKRDFNFAKDTARGMMAITESDQLYGSVINIGSGTEYSIEETIHKVFQITGKNLEIICDEERLRPEKSEVNRLLACNKKITENLGWKTKFDFDQGLELTIDWIQKNLHLFNPTHYNR
jgi:NAD dependent epimerase/dehydratase